MYVFKLYLLIIAFIAYLSSYSQQVTTVLSDNFSNNDNEWLTVNSNSHRAKIANNVYSIHNKLKNGSFAVTKEVDINPENDFTIEASIKRKKGFEDDGYGLTWGRFDNGNNFSFTISENGGFEIGKWENDVWQNMVKSTKSNYIKNEDKFNLLSIQKNNNTISFYINNRIVAELPFENFFGNKIGFIVYHNMLVEVSYIRISGTENFFISKMHDKVRKKYINKSKDQDILIRNIEYKGYKGDTILRSLTNGVLHYKIINNSDNDFKELYSILTPLNLDLNIEYKASNKIMNLKANSTMDIATDIFANKQFQGGEKQFRIDIVEKNGFVANPAEFSISSKAFMSPDVRVEKIIIDDTIDESGKTDRYGNGDSKIDAGEVIDATVYFKNYGGTENNFYAKISLKSRSHDISFREKGRRLQLGSIKSGETIALRFSFFSNTKFGVSDIPFIINLYYSYKHHKEIELGLKLGKIWNINDLVYTFSEKNNLSQAFIHQIADVDTAFQKSEMRNDLLVIIIGSDHQEKDYIYDYAKNDAQIFYQYMKTVFGVPEKNMFIRLNETISSSEFLDLFSSNGWISQRAKNNSMSLIIYFSGHGYINMHHKDDLQILQYINPNYIDENNDTAKANKIYNIKNEKKLKSIAVIVDACFYGNRLTHNMLISENAGIFLFNESQKIPNNNVSFIASSRLDKYGVAYKSKSHSLLSYFIFKTIKSKRANTSFSIQDILDEMNKDNALNINEKRAIENINYLSNDIKKQLF